MYMNAQYTYMCVYVCMQVCACEQTLVGLHMCDDTRVYV